MTRTWEEAGGPAFPISIEETDGGDPYMIHNLGMSLRDWFAGQVLNGMHASCTSASAWPDRVGLEKMARVAYDQADAMLAARNNPSS